jgi:hypothetical protein
MNDFDDPRLAAVERRLERAVAAEPPPALRQRVLMAVDDVLAEKVTATKSANSAQSGAAACPDLVAVTFSGDADVSIPGWAYATAAAVGLAFTLPLMNAVAAPGRAARPALVERLQAAGVVVDDLLALATAPPAAAGPLRSEPDHPRLVHPARRLIDARALLEEHL